MLSDFALLIFSGAFIFCLTALTEKAAKNGLIPYWASRKILHFFAIGICGVLPLLLKDLDLLIALVAGSEIWLVYLVTVRWLFSDENGRRAWGIALFPLAFLAIMILFPDERLKIALPMLILAASDAIAAVAGHQFAKRYYNLTGDKKSVIGNAAFFLSTLTLLGIFFPSSYPFSGWEFWVTLLFIASFLTALEAMGSFGLDNFLVPVGTASLMEITGKPEILLAGLALAAIFAWISTRQKWLTLDGAVAACLVGLWVIAFREPVWLLPLLFFFVGSVIVGKIFRVRSNQKAAKHGKARDWRQVFCNGGVFAFLATFPGSQFETAMWVSIAVSTADTWASETGIYFKWKTFNIVGFKAVPVGISGGISLPGTLGAIAGAGLTAALACFIFGYPAYTFALIAIAGISGMFVDSILGSVLQSRYREPGTDQITEVAMNGAVLEKGWKWMDNDLVNLISNAITTGFVLMIAG